MKSSSYLSLGLLSAVVVWMLSGAFAGIQESDFSPAKQTTGPQKMKVLVHDSRALPIDREIVVQGELEPLRQVEIRSKTESHVSGLAVDKGMRVKPETLLVRLAEEDRPAQIRRAQTEVNKQRFEVAGARKLKNKGLQAENHLKAAEAALAAAEAQLTRAGLELQYTEIRAPFGGVLEERYVELGSHLDKGDRVALLVDDAVLKAVGRVSQQSADKLRLGQFIRIRLLDGREAEGRVTYVSRVGDAGTHSFRVEAQVPNPDGRLNAGVSVELRIAVGRETAHFLSPAVLSLDDSGEVGVKSVDEEGRVRFYPTTLVRTEADGVWLSGMPERVRVITQGQGFVNAGQSVIPVPAS